MRWHISHKYDRRAVPLADRHYNRRKVGAPQFVPPGRALVLLTADASALWITSWPYAQYVKHAWPFAWVNSLFRNEAPERQLSSELIIEACAATVAHFGPPPEMGMVTFVDPRHVRRKRDFGRCYRRAGFVEVGRTKKEKLVALQLFQRAFPVGVPAHAMRVAA